MQKIQKVISIYASHSICNTCIHHFSFESLFSLFLSLTFYPILLQAIIVMKWQKLPKWLRKLIFIWDSSESRTGVTVTLKNCSWFLIEGSSLFAGSEGILQHNKNTIYKYKTFNISGPNISSIGCSCKQLWAVLIL